MPRATPEEELVWREAVWAQLQAHPNWPDLPPDFIRSLGLYGGQAGIWVDRGRTSTISPKGVAVSILSTGKHYDDDIDEDGVIYHYPTTNRAPGHDAGEIAALKEAGDLRMPIFVIIRRGQYRRVKRGWVSDHDDINRLFLLEFAEVAPENLAIEVDSPFVPTVKRSLTVDQIVRVERNPRFKFEVIKRHGGVCAVTGLSVIEMLDGAHVVPVAVGGVDDPRNGLLLSASHHRAYDKHLWCINPDSLRIETSPKGPSLQEMKFLHRDVEHLAEVGALPHSDALEIRFEIFQRATAA